MSYNPSAQHNFLNKYSRLSPNSSEWNRLEYLLQLSLGSTTTSIQNICYIKIHIWSIANPHMTMNFEKKTKNLLVLDSWLETTTQLDDHNPIERVCQKNFDFQNKGLVFPTGHIKLNEQLMGKNKTYEMLFMRTCVGKSYCLPFAKSITKEKDFKLPYGFDSIYFYLEEEEAQGASVFKHDYMVFDNTQVLPMYIVHFEFDSQKEESLSPPICDMCSENTANVYCKSDDAVLCYECDEEHHLKGGKLVQKHQRIPISERPKSFGLCPQHIETKMELYCGECNLPLCIYCKINGNHSQGEMQGHKLVKISEAYNNALRDSREFDPMLEKRKNQLAGLLEQINTRIKDINKNASYLEEKIYKILQDALLQLQQETQHKMSFLIGDQLELKRQYDHIQWLESFLKYQQDILNPSDYLNSWSRHITIRNEIINLEKLPVITKVMPDLRIDGSIRVISENILKMQQEEESQQTSLNQSPDRNQIISGEGSQDPTQGSTKFRNSIFKKHTSSDKNQKLLKSIISNKPKDEKGIQQSGQKNFNPIDEIAFEEENKE